MARYRVPRKGSEFYIPPEEYHTVVNFCLCYGGWKARLATIEAAMKDYKTPSDGVSAVRIDDMPHGTDIGDPTANAAIRHLEGYNDLVLERDRIAYKIKIIEDTVMRECGDVLYQYMMAGVTKRIPFHRLRQEGIPVSENAYGKLRRKIYFQISKRI